MKVDPRFAELYEAEWATVYRAAFVLCRDRGLAEDAAQEAFARALARWRRLRGESWAAAWITTTALNAARRSLRRRTDAPVVAPDAGDPGMEESMDLWRGIGKLPRRQQEAVVLHYVADLTVGDTAAAMGCEEGTVKAHLFRAREALRGQLGGERVG
ncbi:MAG TPA: SigE family RNA polymerase sigma factor [Actinobacteria bacterium]|jgi:RNA polymerase sigma-70 factor (ECF subfamily)|nr:SigE family RNA polymerase sigma factor [Actinomycetota bacterium]